MKKNWDFSNSTLYYIVKKKKKERMEGEDKSRSGDYYVERR